MSIASEIQRLQGVKSDILEAIANKGVTVPVGSALADCPELIGSIGGGGGGDYPTQEGRIAICHRGYIYNYADLVENTIPAFKRAIINGYKYVECDIHHTSDGVPILSHDASIKINENNGSIITISSVSYSTIKNYTYYGFMQKISSLEEVLLLCKEYDITLYIDIKDGTDAQLAADYNLVRSAGMEENVVWISFTMHHLQVIRSIDGYATLDYVVNDGNISPTTISDAAALKTGNNNVGIEYRKDLITQSIVNDVTANGMKVLAWTVDAHVEVLDLHELGVEIFVSNRLRTDKILDSLIVLTKDDLEPCGYHVGYEGLVDYTVTNRATYIGFDIHPENGRVYFFRVTKNPDRNADKTLRFSPQLWSANVYRAFQNGTTTNVTNSERLGYGWNLDNLKITLQSGYTLNFSAPAFMWITFGFTDDSDIDPEDVQKVEIAEISELNMINLNANIPV